MRTGTEREAVKVISVYITYLTLKVVDYGFTARIGFIPDRNPTAFTYGLLRSNARIVVTQGIFEFLNEDEAARGRRRTSSAISSIAISS